MNGYFKWIASALVSILSLLLMYQLQRIDNQLDFIHMQHAILGSKLSSVEARLNTHMNIKGDEKE